MAELKICRICLRTDAKVYNYVQYQLKSFYEEVLALKINDLDDLPHYFCFECAMLLHKFHKFKEKCHFGQKTLKEILRIGPITLEAIHKLERPLLNSKSPLEILYLNPKRKPSIEKISIKEETSDQRFINIEPIEINKTFIDDTEIDTDNKEKIFCYDTDNGRDFKTERQNVKEAKYEMEKRSLLDENKWKRMELNEEEAFKEFAERANDKKYIAAAHKCDLCLKGFSKEDMLKRHKTLTHNESNIFECRFCHMRFKWKCHVKKHMKKHYTKYQCLRCQLVFPIKNSAILHEQYHSGASIKCKYCSEEFRHTSTYYTHLRTHRSEFVCTLCGSSFVSEAGLNMHKRLKHCTDDVESADDDEDLNTFCSRCNIRFETRKAYEEHLFHSALHAEVVEDGIKIEKAEPIPRKILAKKMRHKITHLLKSRNFDESPIKAQSGNAKRRRQKSKPTTCHQCRVEIKKKEYKLQKHQTKVLIKMKREKAENERDERLTNNFRENTKLFWRECGLHFATQAACLRHHLAQHPRTSFCAPHARHVCEICGVSLAPGSVAVHQNMHTRAKMHSCSVCSRQFHSSIGLKRHMLTHTGEKPFACTVCEKRFTQSNSMKLHHRTVHLKQPYPKRNRTKKKDTDIKKSISEDGSEEHQKDPKPMEIEPVLTSTENNPIDYLTLSYQKH